MNLLNVLVVILPWKIKRLILIYVHGYQLHPKAYIGFSWIFPKQLLMDENAHIGHLNVGINLEKITMKEYAKIGRGNWITGFPLNSKSKHFAHQDIRKPELFLGEHTSITKNHHLDCTNQINIGAFTTIAGYRSQFLTHSVNILEGIQDSQPIYIGSYCFVATNVVVLGGAQLPSYSVLGAKSLLNKKFNNEYQLYGGVPAIALKKISKDAAYFTRITGFVI